MLGMLDGLEAGAQRRVEAFLARIGAILGNKKRRACFAVYTMGLLGSAERKSIEPLALQACTDPALAKAAHDRLLHFISDATWDDHEVRCEAAEYALAEMTAQEPVQAWIVDDTGFLKQGTHSVGVQRQYTGSAGKVTNCQVGVSLTLATQTMHLPVDFDLYLPKSWANDRARRLEAKIPDGVVFKTKLQLALDMIRRAIANGLPRGLVLFDAAYGDSNEFRAAIRRLDLDYGAGVSPTISVWRLDSLGRRCGDPVSAKSLAAEQTFRRYTWREGSRKNLSARFAFERVVPAHDDGLDPAAREHLWLVSEWRDDEPEPKRFHLTTLAADLPGKYIVNLLKQRWRTERVYEDMKGELGLDHFEGRLFSGWHHHVSVALCCYAFTAAERARRFPPKARGSRRNGAVRCAA